MTYPDLELLLLNAIITATITALWIQIALR